jgi:hypothetical protein
MSGNEECDEIGVSPYQTGGEENRSLKAFYGLRFTVSGFEFPSS